MAKKQIVLELLFCTILRPLGGSQAAFADKNGFRLQRGRKLRDELLLHTDERLAGGIVARGGGDTVQHHPPEIQRSSRFRSQGSWTPQKLDTEEEKMQAISTQIYLSTYTYSCETSNSMV